MKRSRAVIFVLALASIPLGTGVAAAEETFDGVADNATTLHSHDALASLLWSYLATCDGIEDDFARRQCTGLRAARQTQVAGKTFVIDGDVGSVAVGAYDDARKSVAYAIQTCLACGAPLSIDGQPQYVVGTGGPPAVRGAAVRGNQVHVSSQRFKDQAEAQKWREKVVPRLHTQFLIRVPEGGKPWAKGDVQGVAVDVVGFRVFDKCTGQILAAKPQSAPVEGDRDACPAELLAKRAPPKPKKPKKPKLPPQLTPNMIKVALAPTQDAAQKCYDTFGVAGNSRVRITINNQGAVTDLALEGEFEDTPTGKCILDAVRVIRFPKTKKRSTTITYPYVLR